MMAMMTVMNSWHYSNKWPKHVPVSEPIEIVIQFGLPFIHLKLEDKNITFSL